MVGRQRKAVAVGHKGIAGGFVVDAGAPAHRAAVFRDDQLGVAAVQHLVQFFGQLLLGLVLGLSGAFALPSLGQIGNCIVIALVAEDIAGKVDIALCGCVQRHVELEVVQERLLIRAVGRKAAGRNLGRIGAADDGLGLAQRAVRAVKAIATSLAAGNNAEAQCLALILLQIQRQAADVVRSGQRQHSIAAGIDDAQVIVVNALVVGRRPADRVEQGIRVVGLAVDAGDGARRADAGQALLNAVIRHSGRADFIGAGCRHAGDLEPDLVIAPAVAAVGQHGIHVDRQGKAVAAVLNLIGQIYAFLQRNLLLTGHIAVLVRQQAVELDAVGRRFRVHVLLRPVERIGQLILVIHYAVLNGFRQRRGFQDIQVQLLEDDLRGRLRGLFCPPTLITAHVGEAERCQMGIGIAVLARADDLIAVLPPDFFVGVVCMAGDGCGHFVRRGIPAILHIALAAGDGHRDNEEVGVVRHGIRRQAVQVEGNGRLCHNAFPRGQRDVLAVQRYAVDFVIAQIFCQQHDAVGRAAVLAAVALDLRGKAELHGCFKTLRCLAGVGHIVRVAVLFQRAQRQTVLVLAVIAVVVTPLGREIGL